MIRAKFANPHKVIQIDKSISTKYFTDVNVFEADHFRDATVTINRSASNRSNRLIDSTITGRTD